MDSILSVLTNSQTEIAVIKTEEYDENEFNSGTWTVRKTICDAKEEQNEKDHPHVENPVHPVKTYLQQYKNENRADDKADDVSDGLIECEVNIVDVTTKQQIVKESSNPSLLWFVTKEENRKEVSDRSEKKNYKKRRKADANKTAIECEVCHKQFSKPMYLISHSIKHVNQRTLSCSNCQQTFKHKASLTLHMKTHLAACEKDCKACHQSRCTKHGKVQQYKYSCSLCNKRFQTKQSYEAHCFMHNGQRPYKCKMCPKSFLYKHTLNYHILGHSKVKREKKYNCDRCSKCYEYKSELVRHYAHHSEDRAWLCTICGKAYALQATLKTHIKTHNPSKAYECDTCGSSFMKRSLLEIHIKKVHNLESPSFMCDRCPKQFYSSDGLKQHMVTHTSDKKFMCEICFKFFPTKSRYQAHQRKMHKTEVFRRLLTDSEFTNRDDLSK